MVLGCRDVAHGCARFLAAADRAALRATSSECRDAVDATVTMLRPLALTTFLSTLPALKVLHLDHEHLTLRHPRQLGESLSGLTRLQHLVVAGPACCSVRAHHLAWVGQLTALTNISLRGCTKVRLSVLSNWHSLRQLRSLSLIGLAFTSADAGHLPAFLAAAPGSGLTSLVLGDEQGLTFLGDAALSGLGALLGPHAALHALDLSGCIELTDTGVQHIAGLGSCLHSLALHNCMKLGACAAQLIGSQFAQLTALSLRGCSQFADAQMEVLLWRLARLQTLNLQSCSGLAGSFLHTLGSRLISLHTLNLAFCAGLQTPALASLRLLQRLQRLSLTGCPVVSDAQALAAVAQATGLTRLDGGQWTFRGEFAATAAASSAGLATSSNDDDDDDDDVAGAAQQQPLLLPPALAHLQLGELTCSSGDGLLRALVQHMPAATLTSLDLSNCRAASVVDDASNNSSSNDSWLRGLTALSKLQALNLSGASVDVLASDIGVLASALPELTKLVVSHMRAEGAAGGGMHADEEGECAAWLAAACAAEAPAGALAACCLNADSSSVSLTAAGSGPSSEASTSSGGRQQLQAGSPSDGSSCMPAWTAPRGVAELLAAGGDTSDSGSTSSSNSSLSGPLQLAAAQTSTRRHLFAVPGNALTVGQELDAWAAACALSRLSLAPSQQQQEREQRAEQPPQQQQQQQQQNLLSGLADSLDELVIRFSPAFTDGALASLSSLQRLRSLELLANHTLTGAGFASLASLTGLTAVDLTGCSNLTDDGVAALTAACGPSLRELLLPGCRALTDAGVATLTAAPKLRVLNLSSNKNLSSAALASLFPALASLHTLVLALCGGLCDHGLRNLVAAPSLAFLDLRGCWRLSDAGMHALLSAAPGSLMQVVVDSCPRLSLACCPPGFAACEGTPGSPQLKAISDGAGDSGGRQPSLLVRIPVGVAGPAAAVE